MKIIVLGNQARALSNFWSVLIRRMRQGGHGALCCVPPGDPEADAALEALGAAVIHYELDRKGLNPLHDARTFAQLRQIFAMEKPDLLFASTIKPVIYGCMAARRARVPHIYATITGLGYAFEADSLFKKCVNRLSVLLYRKALKNAEGVFFQNQDDIRIFRESGILKSGARVLTARGTAEISTGSSLADLIRRPQLGYDDLAPFDPERPALPAVVREAVEIRMKYAGYIARQQKQVEEFAREEGRLLPKTIDYLSMQGLRVEARQKLDEIRPLSVGQASRISGVSPADIAVLLIWLEQNKE